jgi:hypothetical protein
MVGAASASPNLIWVLDAARLYAEWKRRKVALTASRRGTSEELGMPVTDDSARLKDRRRNADQNQHHSGGGDGDRSRGVH